MTRPLPFRSLLLNEKSCFGRKEESTLLEERIIIIIIIIIIIVAISIAQYLIDKGEHTALYQINQTYKYVYT